MKDRYDGIKSKDAAAMNAMQSKLQAEHGATNAFVKKKQAEVAGMGGKDPRLDGKLMDFCSYMSNDGEKAQSFARSLTAGLDKKAFPVK